MLKTKNLKNLILKIKYLESKKKN